MIRNKTQHLTLNPKLRFTLVMIFSSILLLEIIFSLFVLPASGKVVTAFDLQAWLAILILVCARPKMFSRGWLLEFRKAPLVYKFAIALAVYVLALKLAYFGGYLVGLFCRL